MLDDKIKKIIEGIKKIFFEKSFSDLFFDLLSKKAGFLGVVTLILVLSFSIYIWHKRIYRPGWDQLRKDQYIQKKEKGIVFNKENFEKVVEEYKLRREELANESEGMTDIFKIEKK